MFKYLCEYCGENFSSKLKNKKYCSISCSNRSRSKSTMVTCLNCEKLFKAYPSSNRKYCCHQCSSEYRNNERPIIQERVCEGCSEVFIPKRRTSASRYCSIKCFANSSDNHGFKNREVGEKLYEHVCKNCGDSFEHRKRDRTYCSMSCMRKYRGRKVLTKTCEYTGCDKEFLSKVRSQRFCSKTCFHKQKSETYKMSNIEKDCPQCGAGFTVKNNQTGRNKVYCSKECHNDSMVVSPAEMVCHNCGSVFYSKRSNVFCSKSCANSGENNSMYGLTGEQSPRYDNSSWTYGKTVKDDPKIAALGRKISKKLKEKFANGEMSNAGESNPMYGKNHTAETKERISTTRSERIINGDYASWFNKGVVHSKKMNKEMVFRSSWEEACINHFDNNDSVAAFEVEPVRILYEAEHGEYLRNYIPDFIVEYVDGKRLMIEIKPEYFVDAKINQAKFKAAREYCDKHNITFEVWTETKINDIKAIPHPIYS